MYSLYSSNSFSRRFFRFTSMTGLKRAARVERMIIPRTEMTSSDANNHAKPSIESEQVDP
jgi:hypothetical protein